MGRQSGFGRLRVSFITFWALWSKGAACNLQILLVVSFLLTGQRDWSASHFLSASGLRHLLDTASHSGLRRLVGCSLCL